MIPTADRQKGHGKSSHFLSTISIRGFCPTWASRWHSWATSREQKNRRKRLHRRHRLDSAEAPCMTTMAQKIVFLVKDDHARAPRRHARRHIGAAIATNLAGLVAGDSVVVKVRPISRRPDGWLKR